MRAAMHAIAGLLLLAGAQTSAAQSLACNVGKSAQVAQLLFGRNIAGRHGVTEAKWERFLATEITPRFPDGLSVTDARGQWRDPVRKRIISERSKVVLIALPGADTDEQRLQEIVAAYKSRFHQQSVGVIVRPACVSF